MSLFRRLIFSLWYYFNPPWDTGISPPELLDFIENHPPGRAIDIGCGTGTNVITLAKAGWQVTGVDFVPRAIKMAKRKVKQAGIEAELYVRDASNLEGISGPFDLVLDIGCFHSFAQMRVPTPQNGSDVKAWMVLFDSPSRTESGNRLGFEIHGGLLMSWLRKLLKPLGVVAPYVLRNSQTISVVQSAMGVATRAFGISW